MRISALIAAAAFSLKLLKCILVQSSGILRGVIPVLLVFESFFMGPTRSLIEKHSQFVFLGRKGISSLSEEDTPGYFMNVFYWDSTAKL